MDLRRLDKVPAVATVMTPFPCTLEADATVSDARRLVAEHDFSHIPVEAGHRLVGLLRAADLHAASADERVASLCESDPYVVDLHESLGVVAREMALRGTDAAVVLREGRLAGIFTASDACGVLARILGESISPEGPDEVA